MLILNRNLLKYTLLNLNTIGKNYRSFGFLATDQSYRNKYKNYEKPKIFQNESLVFFHSNLFLNKRFYFRTPNNWQKSENDQNNKSTDPNKKPDEDDNKIQSMLAKAFFWMMSAYMIVAFITLFMPHDHPSEASRFVSWNEFVYQMLAKGEVEEIIVRPDSEVVTIILADGAIYKGKRVDQKVFFMNVVDVNKFEQRLRVVEKKLGVHDGIQVNYERRTDALSRILMTLFIAGLLMSFLARGKNIRSPINMDAFSSFTRAKFTLVHPVFKQGKGVKFNDVAGLKEAKTEVIEFVDYLKRPQHYKRLGAKVPKGALLLGPPGCGKTLLAKAVATEANVPFLSMNGSEFIEMIGGLGAARVRDLFKEAKERAPCIIYIDEIDAIGKKRSTTTGDISSGESEQTLNQLLVEMDGMASKEGVILLASTNRAEVLDKALLRPGRFDRHILIDLPNLEERKETFEVHLKSIKLELKPEDYSNRLASLTAGFSGADIANVCNEAALHAARHKKKIVTESDLEYAVERLVAGTEKRTHAMTPAEKRIVAFHESGHALVGWMLKYTETLLKISIVPRTTSALGFSRFQPNEHYLYTKEELFERMCMMLGGRAAELLIFNRVTTGAQDDLQKVTKLAYAQVTQFGMCQKVGLVSFDEEIIDNKKSRKPFSKKLQALMDLEANRIVSEAFKKTGEILNENKAKLKILAEELIKSETLNYNDIEKLIGPPKYGKKKSELSIESVKSV